MRIWLWEIEVSRVYKPKRPIEPRYGITHEQLVNIVRSPRERILRNQSTGETIWVNPFGRCETEVLRGVGSIAKSTVLESDIWVELTEAKVLHAH